MTKELFVKNLKPFIVRSFMQEDFDDLFRLHKDNEYYNLCIGTPNLNKQQVLGGLESLPPDTKPEQKHYIGIFEGKLLACIDYIEGYPDAQTVFLGLLMVDNAVQGQGLGTKILDGLCSAAKEQGYKKIRLACLKSNQKAFKFWQKQGFIESERKQSNHFLDNKPRQLIIMEKIF